MQSVTELKSYEKQVAEEATAKRKKASDAYDMEKKEEEARAKRDVPKALAAIEKEIKKCVRREGEYTYHSEKSIKYSVGEGHYADYLGDLLCKELDKLGYRTMWHSSYCEADYSDPDAPGTPGGWYYAITVSW